MSKEHNKHKIAREQLGQFFKNRREELLLSLEELSSEIGISENTLIRIETGNLDFELSLLFRICDSLGLKPYFVPYEDAIEFESNFPDDEENEPKSNKPILEDAHAMSIIHKDFDFPSNEEILNIKIGDFVKVNASGERFWVKVEFTDFGNRTIYGIVDNDLVDTESHGLKLGDSIELKFENIYAIHK